MTFIIGTPHANGAGYFLNNQAGPARDRQEADIATCTHCEAIIKLQEWKNEGGWCAKCQAPLCSNPKCMEETARLGCVPFTKKLIEHIEATEKQAQYRKIAGLEPPVSPQPIYTGNDPSQ